MSDSGNVEYPGLPATAATAPTGLPAIVSASTSKRNINYKFFKPVQVKLNNLESLSSHENYEDWARKMKMVFLAMGCGDIVANGVTPAADADDNEYQAYEVLSRQARLLHIQLVSKPILC